MPSSAIQRRASVRMTGSVSFRTCAAHSAFLGSDIRAAAKIMSFSERLEALLQEAEMRSRWSG